jgi:hypothetical protein
MYNVYNIYYLICLGLILEAQIRENVVYQMKEFLVNHGNLHDNCSIDQMPATERHWQ